VAAGDVLHGVGHRQHGQAGRQRHAQQPYADVGKRGRQRGAAVPPEHQPEGADELRSESVAEFYTLSSVGRMVVEAKIVVGTET